MDTRRIGYEAPALCAERLTEVLTARGDTEGMTKLRALEHARAKVSRYMLGEDFVAWLLVEKGK